MQQLSNEGQAVVNEIAARHGFSTDAVTHMLIAVLNGNGSMAQFSHPEFGGSGQWMKGGMLMLGDMFNHQLKGRVNSLCYELCGILSNQTGLLSTGSFQHQSQSGSGHQAQAAGGMRGQSRLFVPDPNDNWWPQDLGPPNATGSQNNVRYAYFAGPRRLAVKTGDQVWVYNTLDHQVGGFSQQQGMGGSILFTSQLGTVDLTKLPVVSRNGQPVAPEPIAPDPVASQAIASPATTSGAPGGSTNAAASADVFTAIERLGELKGKGLLSDEEFASKKAELLSRL